MRQDIRLTIFKSGQPASRIKAALSMNQNKPLEPVIGIKSACIEDCTNIVALAGAEQIQKALETNADIVIAGRTTDTAIIVALPLMRGCHSGAAWHEAKIGECGALATTKPR